MWQLAVVSSSPCKSHLQGIWRQFGWILQRCADARVALGASSLPFRGSPRSCDKMGWVSSLLSKMGWMSSLLTCWGKAAPHEPSPAQECQPKQMRNDALLGPPPWDPLFFKPTSLLGNRNTPLKGLWVNLKRCSCKVQAWCDCVGTGRVFWSSYCRKLSCPISKMICAIHCWLFLSIH